MFHLWNTSITVLEQIVVPETLRPRLIPIANHSNMGGHPGWKSMLLQLR